jgi:hypothetical protein
MIDDMATEPLSTVQAPARGKTVVWLAWGYCAAVMLAAVAASVVALRNRSGEQGILNMAADVTTLIMFVVFGVTGALIVSHQPRNIVGWILMLQAALVFVWPLDTYYSTLAKPPAQPSFLFMLGLWFTSWLWLWLVFPVLFIPLFFPTGRPPSPRWRWLIVVGLGLCAFFILFATFSMEVGPSNDTWTVPNPVGLVSRDSFPIVPWAVTLLSFAASCVASLFVRYRRAQAVEREQIRWLLYAAGLFFIIYALGFLTSEMKGLVADLWGILLFVGFVTLPLAIMVAILRYRLYDIDVIIRKTLVYAVLTALLVLVYFGSVVLLQRLFGRLTGVAQSPLAVVVSTLAIAALFTPLRRRIQDVIDRRFYRKKYDAQCVLAQFAVAARDETDLDALTAELARVVQETLQPERVSVWLSQQTVQLRAGDPAQKGTYRNEGA